MIKERRNADGSLTIGIIEEDEPIVIPIKEKPVKEAEAKAEKPKTTTKKKTATK